MNPASERINKKRKQEIEALFRSLPRIKGQVRTVKECGDCGRLFGRCFIPFGIGQGISINMCLCQLTAQRPHKTIAERRP